MRSRLFCALCAPAALVAAAPAAAQVSPQLVTDRVQDPAYVSAPSGDFRRLFISSQHGGIHVVKDGRLLSRPFADLSPEVLSPADPGGVYEQGLASFAFAPDYRRSGMLYVAFTDREGDVRVEERRRSPADPDVADPSYRRLLLEVPHREAPSHNGGQLQFGPDGHLYVSIGDSGTSERIVMHAQNLNLLLGKLLRIDPRESGGAAYRVPADNPYVGGSARPEIWAYGLRNPYRFSFDRSTGDLAIADVGQDSAEEVNLAPLELGNGRGANYGWPYLEGTQPRQPGLTPSMPTVAPVLEHLHSAGFCAVTGGYVVRDRAVASLYGRYIYADLCSPPLRYGRLRLPRASEDTALGLRIAGITSFGEDAAGCVYGASHQDAVYLLSSGGREVPCRDRFAPRLRARAARRQRALRRGPVTVFARCDERCSITARGHLRVGRRWLRLGRARALSSFGRRVALRLRLPAATRRAQRRELRRGRRLTARLRIRARDVAGNRSRRARRSVRVLRR